MNELIDVSTEPLTPKLGSGTPAAFAPMGTKTKNATQSETKKLLILM
jgi:hypothetical protein